MAAEHIAVLPFPDAVPWLQVHCTIRSDLTHTQYHDVQGNRLDKSIQLFGTHKSIESTVSSVWAELVAGSGSSNRGSLTRGEMLRTSQRSTQPSGCVSANQGRIGSKAWRQNGSQLPVSSCLLKRTFSLRASCSTQQPLILLGPPDSEEQTQSTASSAHSDHQLTPSIASSSTEASIGGAAELDLASINDSLQLRMRADSRLDRRQLSVTQHPSSAPPPLKSTGSNSLRTPPTRRLAQALQRALARSSQCRRALQAVAAAAASAELDVCRCPCPACTRDHKAARTVSTGGHAQRVGRLRQAFAAVAQGAVAHIQAAAQAAICAFNKHTQAPTLGPAHSRPHTRQLCPSSCVTGSLCMHSRRAAGMSLGEQAVLQEAAQLAAQPCPGFDARAQRDTACTGEASCTDASPHGFSFCDDGSNELPGPGHGEDHGEACASASYIEALAARTAPGLQYAPRPDLGGGQIAKRFIRGSLDADARAVRARLLGSRSALASKQYAAQLQREAEEGELHSSIQRAYHAAHSADALLTTQRRTAMLDSAAQQCSTAPPGLPVIISPADSSCHTDGTRGEGERSLILQQGWAALSALQCEGKGQQAVAWGGGNEHFMGPLYAPAVWQ